MIITALAVISKNGFITKGKGRDTQTWASPEDHVNYAKMLMQFEICFMGNITYELFKDTFKLDNKLLRVVFTQDTKKYASVPGKLEFTLLNAKHVVTAYEKKGFDRAAVLGGSYTYTRFLQAGLLDEMYITVEPVTFTTGRPLFAHTHLQALNDFKLESDVPLNSSGTVLRHYVKITS